MIFDILSTPFCTPPEMMMKQSAANAPETRVPPARIENKVSKISVFRYCLDISFGKYSHKILITHPPIALR